MIQNNNNNNNNSNNNHGTNQGMASIASNNDENDQPDLQSLIAEFYENLLENRYVEAGNMCKLMNAKINKVSDIEIEMIQDCKRKFSNKIIPGAIGALNMGDINTGIDLFALCSVCGQKDESAMELKKFLTTALNSLTNHVVEELKSLHSIVRLATLGKQSKGGNVQTEDPFPYVTGIQNVLSEAKYLLDIAPCPGMDASHHLDIMDNLCLSLNDPILQILKLFKEGKNLLQWEMFVLGNAELPRRAQSLDENAVKDIIDVTLAECSILCGEINKFLLYADLLLSKVKDAVKNSNMNQSNNNNNNNNSNNINNNNSNQQKNIVSTNINSKFNSKAISIDVQKMLTSYLIIDQYCIAKNMKNAIMVSELDYSDESMQISSLVDDTFYIVRSAYDRSLLSMYEFAVSATTNHIKMALEDFLLQELTLVSNGDIIYTNNALNNGNGENSNGMKNKNNDDSGGNNNNHDDGTKSSNEKKLEDKWSKAMETFLDDDEEEEEEENGNSSPHNLIKKKSNAMSTLSIKGTGSRKKRNELHDITLIEMVVSINSSEAASIKTKQFLKYALQKFQNNFGKVEKLDPFKHDLTNLALRFDSLADHSIEYVINRYIEHVKEILRKELVQLSFDITSDEHQFRRSNDGYVDSFLALLNSPDGLIKRCKRSLSTPMFACLLQCFAYTLSGILIKVYKSKAYNELGALILQADLRKMVDGMNNLLLEGSVRSQMEELQVFVWLLNVERPADVKDSPLINKSSMSNILSPTDIGKILSLRVEISFLKEVERLYHVTPSNLSHSQNKKNTTMATNNNGNTTNNIISNATNAITSGENLISAVTGDTINGVLDSIGGFMSMSYDDS